MYCYHLAEFWNAKSCVSLLGECHGVTNIVMKRCEVFWFCSFLIAVVTLKSSHHRKQCFRTDALTYKKKAVLKKDLVDSFLRNKT